MKVIEERFYNGAKEKIERLGISIYSEVIQLLSDIPLTLLEKKDSNSGAVVREHIDSAFTKAKGWSKTQTGDIDWRKCLKANGTQVCVGVEVQVSARSDLVVIDIMHLRSAIEKGSIDLGLIVVPSDNMALYLTDRAPTFRETVIAIEDRMRADVLPLVVVAIEHDGPGPALPKKAKRTK